MKYSASISSGDHHFNDIILLNKQSLDYLMEYVWNPTEVSAVYHVVHGVKDDKRIIVTVSAEDYNCLITVPDLISAGMLTMYFMKPDHEGDEITARRITNDKNK